MLARTRVKQSFARKCLRERAGLVGPRRSLLTLAIESSCDDTAVAVLEKHDFSCERGSIFAAATLHFNRKITADNSVHRGIHPITSQDSHQENLAKLIASSLADLPKASSSNPAQCLPIHAPGRSGTWLLKKKPDFVSVTRGPGMRGSLSAGLDTAKGLAVAWQVPLLGVHHMQAHALTPRLVASLQKRVTRGQSSSSLLPSFPFLSLLASGGHTVLLESKSLVDHTILTETSDIAVGDTLDKIGRDLIPATTLENITDGMYARALEAFCFPPIDDEACPPSLGSKYGYIAPATLGEEYYSKPSAYGWSLTSPFSTGTDAGKSRSREFTFTGIGSQVRKICQTRGPVMSERERQELGREAMRILFEHIANRVVTALESTPKIDTLVLSGGVASNAYLRHIITSYIKTRYTSLTGRHITLSSPPISLCTDNAAMIAWAGIEMWEAGWRTDLKAHAVRRWSLDPAGSDGGILGVEGWHNVKS